jgi:hypothetical protein
MEKDYVAHVSESVRKWASPGPAYYRIPLDFKGNCPTILMKGRHESKLDRLDPPYLKIPTTFGNVPKIHMHGKSDLAAKFHPPGPNYMPARFGLDGHKIGFVPHSGSSPTRAMTPGGSALGMRRSPDETPGPGPGMYSTRLREFDDREKRGCSIIGHHDFHYDKIASPGPGTYRPNYPKIQSAAPKWTIKERLKKRQPDSTAEYRQIGSTLSGHRYTMKRRATDNIELI